MQNGLRHMHGHFCRFANIFSLKFSTATLDYEVYLCDTCKISVSSSMKKVILNVHLQADNLFFELL